MDCARMVAVVVPSPATSDVFDATSRTICAPMFSSGSFRSISFATVTPSLVIVGLPNFLSRTTFRPLGPRVTFTASASWSTPRLRRARASTSKCSSLALAIRVLLSGRSADHGEDVGFLDDEDFLVVEGHLGAAVLCVQNLLTLLELHRHSGALFEAAGTDGDDLALVRFLFGGVGDVQ